MKVGAGCTAAAAGIGFVLAGALPVQAAPQGDSKVWICIYLGNDLKPGENASRVDSSSLSLDPTQIRVGNSFPTGQNTRVIISLDETRPSNACPPQLTPGGGGGDNGGGQTDPGTGGGDNGGGQTDPGDNGGGQTDPGTKPPSTPSKPAPTVVSAEHSKAKPPAKGGLSVAAPHTGGSGEAPAAPSNTVIGGGLLFAALGLFSRNVLGGRKSEPDGTN